MLPAETVKALFDELGSIEKTGGLKDVLKDVPSMARKVPAAVKQKADNAALKTITKVRSNKVGRAVVDNVMDPMNVADWSHGIGNIMRMLGK